MAQLPPRSASGGSGLWRDCPSWRPPAGPWAAPPRTPEENETATPWRRPRQGLGARGQGSAPRTKARARGPSTRGRRCWWGGLLLPTPTTQGHREKTLFAQKGELAPQDAAGAALSHPSLMWARLLILRRNGLEDSLVKAFRNTAASGLGLGAGHGAGGIWQACKASSPGATAARPRGAHAAGTRPPCRGQTRFRPPHLHLLPANTNARLWKGPRCVRWPHETAWSARLRFTAHLLAAESRDLGACDQEMGMAAPAGPGPGMRGLKPAAPQEHLGGVAEGP